MIKNTGERFLPWDDDPMMNYEHLHRYAFCSKLTKEKRVLDLACGEGYGTYILSKSAKHVTGIDVDPEIINHASSKYIKANIKFIQGSILEIPIGGQKVFDVIICFEAIEHVEDHNGLLREVKRLLKSNGIFILSTPNKKVYSDEINFKNPFHAREFYFNDLKSLLREHFKFAWFFGQNIFSGSDIFPLFGQDDIYSEEFVIEKSKSGFEFSSKDCKPSKYFIAIASDADLLSERVHEGSHLIDAHNSIFKKLKDGTIDHLQQELEQRDKQIKMTENYQREIQLMDLELLKKEDKIRDLLDRNEKQEWHYAQEVADLRVRLSEHGEFLENLQLQKEFQIREDKIKELIEKHEEQKQHYTQEVADFRLRLSEHGELLENLQKELCLREEKITDLLEKYEEQKRHYTQEVSSLQLRLSEYVGLAKNLQRDFQIREDKIKELIEKYEEQGRHYTDEVSKRDLSIYYLKNQIVNLEARINAMLSTKTWKLGEFSVKVMRIVLPFIKIGASYGKKEKGREDKAPPSSTTLRIEEKRGMIDQMEKEETEKKELPSFSTNEDKKSKIAQQYDVICLPIIDWFFRFQRPQQILSQFAQNGSRIFYINPQFLNRNKGSFQCKEIQGDIFDVSITANPILNIYKDTINGASLEDMIDSLRALREEKGIVEAVTIVQLPFWQPLANKIKEEFGWKIIYDCMDEHSGFSTNDESMLSRETLLTKDCDLLIVTAQSLYEKMRHYNERCILLPNASDFDHFSHLPPNELLKEMKKPIIGYYGAISDWFDNELVEYLAISKKDWNFVFIGHTFGSDIARLEKISNVHFLGEKPYDQLPKYLYWFDVCIIPFKLNKLTKATNPVKFYELMSSGKKVVSVEIPELLPYAKHLYLAKDKSDFLKNIESALQENDKNLIGERIELAKKNTWEDRYHTLISEIRHIYPKVSIIIVTFNNLNCTKLCMESIFSKSQYPNYEVIFVDNHSDDGTKEYLHGLASRHPQIHVIFNPRNEGFPKANNQGICASSGEYIIFLNNDTIVTRGWISKLLKHLQDDTIGLVGPVTNFSGNESKMDVPYKELNEMEGFSEDFIKKHFRPELFDIRVLALFCVAMKKRLIDEVGLLDEQFQIGMFEDDDFAHRVRLRGYRVVCAEDVFIHHFGEASFNKLKETGEYRKIFDENKRRFEEKWGIPWQAHQYREIKT